MTSKNGRASFSSAAGALLAVPHTFTPGESRNFDLTTSSSSPQDAGAYTVADPAYLSSQLKTSEWLQRYGLKSQKLTFDQILQQVGFKRVESFNSSVGKTVSAKYAGNLYHEVQQDNGDRYVLTCRPEKLREFRNRLIRMLNLLRKRLTFITSGSRRVFGIIGEPSVCIVCDCKTSDHRIFNQFQAAVTSLLKEQVTKIKRFNIIWISYDNVQFQEQPIDVTPTTIDQAIDWICERKHSRNKISISSTCEAILKAFKNTVHSIYLITEGDSSDSAREMLRDNIVKTRLSSNTPIPIHVVSLFCQNNDTEIFLRSIAQTADGGYFSYKIKSEIVDLKASSNLNDPTRIKLQDNKLQFGTNALSSKPEYPSDITLMYKEILQCQNITDRLEKILGFLRDENEHPVQSIDTTKSLDASNMSSKTNKNEANLQRSLIVQSSALFNNDENDMASIDWLKIYGIEAQKLDFFSALQSAGFRHCDGIVTLHKPPENTSGKGDSAPAYAKDKLINAKYCDQFAHVAWPDGTIRHVYVTTELYRDYERRIRALMEKIKARLLWLKKGSRDVFGTILEKNIYILIDTSKSMQNHLNFVKDKLRLLIQDQLFTKERINMVSFNTIINPWRDRLTKVNDSTTQSQLQPWIDELNAEGSTDTLSALRFALADSGTEAIYLLTDGRPDQNERHILSQVQYRQAVPTHTIAFNCQDQTANQFLFDLAKQTGGRFHAFNYGSDNQSSVEIPESEDLTYLKQELARGDKDLERVAALRDECMGRTWTKDNAQSQYKSPQLNGPSLSAQVNNHSTVNLAVRASDSVMAQRLDRKKRSAVSLNRKRKCKSATQLFEKTNTIHLNPDQWLLPETEEYLKDNDKQKKRTSVTENDDQDEESTRTIPTPFGEVKAYLKKNSLVSKGLTIFDVLYPTSITIKEPRYVQVIDRYVLAKVWDDILPLTYGPYADKFRLVNHYAVDLEKYESKLRELIADYYQFTARFIWRCLNDEDKRKLGPGIYWYNLSKEDQNRNAQEITKDEHTSQSALELYVWRKLTDGEQNDLLKRPVIYNEKNEQILKNALNNAEYKSALQGVNRMDVEIKRATKFLQISTDLRQHQRRAQNESKPNPDQISIVTRKSYTTRIIGQRVIGRYDGDGYYYFGTIQKNEDDRTIVLFDMDIEQEVKGHTLLPANNSNSLTNLFLNDRVLVRQMRDMEEYWAPGLIMCLPSPFVLPPNLYKIQIHNPFPKQIYVHRKDMIRITLGLYQRTVFYLQNINRDSFTHRGSIIVEPVQPPPTSPGLSQLQIENILHQFLDPLTEKIERIDESHNERCNQLQTALEDQMGAIRILQERRTKTQVKFAYAQTVRIPTTPRTRTPPPARTRTPPPARTSTPPPARTRTPPPARTPTPPPARTPTPPPARTRTPARTPTPPPTGTPPPDSQIIKPDTHVYAVWFDDDRLVYEGIVLGSNSLNNYIVERIDLPGVQSSISREDIFLDLDLRYVGKVDEQSFALVKYPNDSRHCWCPSAILRHRHRESKTRVRFYDCLQQDLDNNQYVIPITKEQFERYVTSRIEKERSLINQVTVGLNEQTNTFMLGIIKDRLESGHEYLIEWSDKSKNEQKEEHLFGAFTRRDEHRIDGYVLARDINDDIYKPAKVKFILNHRKNLTVQFIDLSNDGNNSTSRQVDVPAATTFVITEAYFKTIIKSSS